jgi:hypothetical protein
MPSWVRSTRDLLEVMPNEKKNSVTNVEDEPSDHELGLMCVKGESEGRRAGEMEPWCNSGKISPA